MSSGTPKRKADEMENKDEGTTTPKKEDVREDGHYSTPVAKRLNYDFWNQNKTPEKLEISQLNAENFINQEITFRVTLKSEIKETTSGKVLSFRAMDQSGEITIIAFRDQAEKYNEIIQINSIFKLESFNLKKEDEQYKSGTGHNFEIILNSSSELTTILDPSSVPGIPFQFIPIEKAAEKSVNSKIDIIGVLVYDWGVETTAKGAVKRDISITDKSKSTIAVTMWGAKAQQLNVHNHCIIAIRNGSVSNYLGKTSVNCNRDTLVWISPDIEEGNSLEEWFSNEMQNMSA